MNKSLKFLEIERNERTIDKTWKQLEIDKRDRKTTTCKSFCYVWFWREFFLRLLLFHSLYHIVTMVRVCFVRPQFRMPKTTRPHCCLNNEGDSIFLVSLWKLNNNAHKQNHFNCKFSIMDFRFSSVSTRHSSRCPSMSTFSSSFLAQTLLHHIRDILNIFR